MQHRRSSACLAGRAKASLQDRIWMADAITAQRPIDVKRQGYSARGLRAVDSLETQPGPTSSPDSMAFFDHVLIDWTNICST